jgi:hypothetical protein
VLDVGGLVQQRVEVERHLGELRGGRVALLLRHGRPSARAAPVVHEAAERAHVVAAGQHRFRVGGDVADLAQGRVVELVAAAQQVEGGRLDERQAAEQLGARARDVQRHGAAIRMPNQVHRFAELADQAADDRGLLGQAELGAAGPRRARAVTDQVGCDDAVPTAEPSGERAPLRAGRSAAVQEDDGFGVHGRVLRMRHARTPLLGKQRVGR